MIVQEDRLETDALITDGLDIGCLFLFIDTADTRYVPHVEVIAGVHEHQIFVGDMELNVHRNTFNRIVIGILQQLIYECRFLSTKLLAQCV